LKDDSNDDQVEQDKRLQINRLVNRLQMSKSSSQVKQEKENLVTRADARVFSGIERNHFLQKPTGEGLTPEEAMIMNVYIESFQNELKRKQKVGSSSKLERFKDLGLNNTGTLLTAAMIRAWPSKDIEALQARAKHLSSKVSRYLEGLIGPVIVKRWYSLEIIKLTLWIQSRSCSLVERTDKR
jgi:hypothetical protein